MLDDPASMMLKAKLILDLVDSMSDQEKAAKLKGAAVRFAEYARLQAGRQEANDDRSSISPLIQEGMDSIIQELRADFRRDEQRLKYLGDTGLPAEMELKLMEIERSREIRDKAVLAVQQTITDETLN